MRLCALPAHTPRAANSQPTPRDPRIPRDLEIPRDPRTPRDLDMSIDLAATEFLAEDDVLSPENVKRVISQLPHVCDGRVKVSEQLVGVFKRAQPNFKVHIL